MRIFYMFINLLQIRGVCIRCAALSFSESTEEVDHKPEIKQVCLAQQKIRESHGNVFSAGHVRQDKRVFNLICGPHITCNSHIAHGNMPRAGNGSSVFRVSDLILQILSMFRTSQVKPLQKHSHN